MIYVVTKDYLSDWLFEMDKLESKVRSSMKASKEKKERHEYSIVEETV